MRVLSALVLVSMFTAAASAQAPPITVGPVFSEKSVNAALFDAAFEVKVTVTPSVPLLWSQTGDARFDAIVCNDAKAGAGWVKVNPNAPWGVLQPGDCTMFGNFSQLSLTTPGDNKEWTAKVFLRARR